MPSGEASGRIEVHELIKRFGPVLAVDRLSFTVEPGRVTGFLGPNGAGKTTTLRALLGLVTPTSGSATIGGLRYRDLPHPQREVGALLEASNFHPGRSGRDHLRVLAETAGVAAGRVEEVLNIVGLIAYAKRRAGGYSMGMRQRLGLAGALLGDPRVLILDEPANGLDPEGIRWMRGFLRTLAGEGRTILIASHVLSEVEQTVDDVVIIARGRLVHASSLAELEVTAGRTVYVVSPDRDALLAALLAAGLTARPAEDGPDGQRTARSAEQLGSEGQRDPAGAVLVEGATPAEVGKIAFAARIELHELRRAEQSLEETFLRLVADEPARRAA
jgi:ABC-2 type transport system ATP-binding protein